MAELHKLLCQRLQLHSGIKKDRDVVYTTAGVAGGNSAPFVCTLEIPALGKTFEGDSMPRKVIAEQSAAAKALDKLTGSRASGDAPSPINPSQVGAALSQSQPDMDRGEVGPVLAAAANGSAPLDYKGDLLKFLLRESLKYEVSQEDKELFKARVRVRLPHEHPREYVGQCKSSKKDAELSAAQGAWADVRGGMSPPGDKTRLKEELELRWKNAVAYDVRRQDDSFVATVTIPSGGKYTGQARSAKKAAEQSAAETALESLLGSDFSIGFASGSSGFHGLD